MGSKLPRLIKAIGKRDSVDDGVIEDSPRVDRPFINGNSNMIAFNKKQDCLIYSNIKNFVPLPAI